MSSLTVRIDKQSHRVLKQLAREAGSTQQAVLSQAVEALRRQRFLDRSNQAYADLRKDRKAWAEEKRERALWEKIEREFDE